MHSQENLGKGRGQSPGPSCFSLPLAYRVPLTPARRSAPISVAASAAGVATRASDGGDVESTLPPVGCVPHYRWPVGIRDGLPTPTSLNRGSNPEPLSSLSLSFFFWKWPHPHGAVTDSASTASRVRRRRTGELRVSSEAYRPASAARPHDLTECAPAVSVGNGFAAPTRSLRAAQPGPLPFSQTPRG